MCELGSTLQPVYLCCENGWVAYQVMLYAICAPKDEDVQLLLSRKNFAVLLHRMWSDGTVSVQKLWMASYDPKAPWDLNRVVLTGRGS